MNAQLSVFSTFVAIIAIAWCSTATAQETDWVTTPPDPQVPQGENLDVPEGWLWRLDRPHEDFRLVASEERDDDEAFFVNMTPGWHITTGPALILYHPALTASGRYRAQATYHLFPPGERNEAFGLFVGGENLEADNQTYLYFLIRRSGEYLIKRRDGDETSVVTDWTAHPAIVPFGDDTEGTPQNTLRIETQDESIVFYVNDEQVTSVARAGLPSDGIVGLRVNHGLNVHVSDLGVDPLE